MTRSLQATLSAGSGVQTPAGAGIARALAAVVREIQGWIAAARDTRVPAHARNIRAQRLMRSW